MPEAVVPYLRMSGRWLEENGFTIGSGVQVVVERGRVTLISTAVDRDDESDDERPPAAGPRARTHLLA
ncbi:MAG TPA: SymE family type I addiction module toxin [Thermoanaerobaculia bacterium]|jgi:hypothetical protein